MYYPNPNQNNDDGGGLGRIMLVIALSIGFFAVYMTIFPPEQKHSQHNAPNQDTISTNALEQATNNANNIGNAPIAQSNPATPKDNAQNFAPQAQSNIPLKDSLISVIESKDFEIEIDALGRIREVYLKDEKFTRDEQESLFSIIGSLFGGSSTKPHIDKLALFGESELRALEVRFSDNAINQKAFSTPYIASAPRLEIESSRDSAQKSSQTLTLTQNLGEVSITKELKFYEDLTYEAHISVSNPNIEYFISNGMRPKGDKDNYVFRGVLLKKDDGSIKKIEDGDAQNEDFPKSRFIASVDRYYTSLFYTKDLAKGLNIRIGRDLQDNPMPYMKLYGQDSFYGYIGPKDYKNLEHIYKELSDVVEYGVFTFFAEWIFLLLDWLYGICGNWGWAIVLLTLLVRLVLFPLSYKGILSMQKLKDIAPMMKEIQTRYKGDPQKMQMQMMELYKKHGANPLGGCLPLLLQIPVFFAIYRVLYNAIELKNSDWIFWIRDLSAIDPYFVLPVLMGVTMYLSQILTPSNFTDPMQEKVFKMLPWFFMIFFIVFPFPAGLVLYWTINNIFSIIRQLVINKVLERKKAIAQKIKEKKEMNIEEQTKHKGRRSK